MKSPKSHFLLNPEYYYVNGAKKGAVYDLENNRIISLDPELSTIIKECEDGKALDKITEFKAQKVQALEVLNNFNKLGLGRFYDNFYKVEKIKPSISRFASQLSSHPMLKGVQLELTTKCNLNCTFCWANTYKVNRKTGCKKWPESHNKKDLTKNDWSIIIEDLIKMKCKRIFLIGGEPLLELEKLFTILNNPRIKKIDEIYIYTNATLINDDICEFFAKNNIKLNIQFYSHIESHTDKITRVKGTHKKIINAIAKCREYEIDFLINLIKLQNYSNYYSESIQYIKSFNPTEINETFVLPRKIKGVDFSDNFPVDIIREKDLDINYNHFDRFKFFQSCSGNTCWDSKLSISSSGDITPCSMAKKVLVAKVKEKNLREVIRDKDLEKYWALSRDEIEICKDCEFRYACNDCRPLEQSFNDEYNLYGKGNFCKYDPYKGEWEN